MGDGLLNAVARQMSRARDRMVPPILAGSVWRHPRRPPRPFILATLRALRLDQGAMSAVGFASFRRVLTWSGNDVHLVGGNRVLALLADQPGSELAPAICVLCESRWTR